MMDFNSKNMMGEKFVELIDQGIEHKASHEVPRDYLGGSLIGESCERALQYHFLHAPGANEFPPRIRRIFARGHNLEDLMAEWIRGAGFELVTKGKGGRQIGFEDCDGMFKGHADGVFLSGPEQFAYPALWECKALGSRGFNQLRKNGLKRTYPKYYAQVQTYMAYLRLAEHPAIFTAVNADTMDIEAILVPFDPEEAQACMDRAARVLTAIEHQELLPRGYSDPDCFACRMCPFNEVCWQGERQ